MKPFWKKKKDEVPKPPDPTELDKLDAELKKLDIKKKFYELYRFDPEKLAIERKNHALNSIAYLRWCLESHVVDTENQLPGSELKLIRTFNDAEIEILKNRLFKLLDEI
jgi:hypothetical protein